MKKTGRILNGVGMLSAVVFMCFICWVVYSVVQDVRLGLCTGVGVSRKEVKRVKMPKDASDISYWSDGHMFVAEYTTSEEALQKRYNKFEFKEITENECMPHLVYGTDQYPIYTTKDAEKTYVTNGIVYRSVWNNGGGYDIVFDRITKRVYVNMAPN